MKRVSSDAFRVLLYFVAAFLLAAALSPLVYNFGKTLAEIAANKETNAILSAIARSAERAEFSGFFECSLTLSALLLLPFLTLSLRMSTKRRIDDGPLPKTNLLFPDGQALEKNPQRWLHLTVGFLLASTLLLFSGYLAVMIDAFHWKEKIDWGRSLRKAIPPALFIPLLEEWIFRGILLGIFIRCLGPWIGTISLSGIFAAVHFMVIPNGQTLDSPESTYAGFRYLGLVLQQFGQPHLILGEFLTLFIVALILSYARIRTASLWFPIGLHAGWIFAFKIFQSTAQHNPDAALILAGNNLRSGLFTIVMLGLTGLLVRFFLQGSQTQPETTK